MENIKKKTHYLSAWSCYVFSSCQIIILFTPLLVVTSMWQPSLMQSILSWFVQTRGGWKEIVSREPKASLSPPSVRIISVAAVTASSCWLCWQNLKQLLNMTLGGLGHRIRPRQKGDKVLYVHFQSEDEMKIAQSLLHNQDFLGYTLHAKVRGYSLINGQNLQTERLFR